MFSIRKKKESKQEEKDLEKDIDTLFGKVNDGDQNAGSQLKDKQTKLKDLRK